MNTQQNQVVARQSKMEGTVSSRPFVTDVSVADLLSPFKAQKHQGFVEFLLSRRGQYMSVLWGREMKLRAAYKGQHATKLVRAVCRAGIDYDKTAAVIEKREAGELPEENAGLPWGTWLKFPYLIEHKGNLYVRLYPSRNPAHRVKTDYFLDGKPSDAETLKPMCQASEFKEETPDCFTVGMDKVIETLEVAG